VQVSQVNSSFYADDMLVPVPERRGRLGHHTTLARSVCVVGLLAADAYSGRSWDLTAAVNMLFSMLVD